MWLRKLVWFFKKQFQHVFFRKMSWEVSLRISSRALEVTGLDRPRRLSCQTPQKSPRRCHWVMSNEKTKKQPNVQMHADMQDKDISCTRHADISYLPGPIQTYPKNTHANLPLERALDMDGNVRKKSAASKMWALLDKKSRNQHGNVKLLRDSYSWSTCFSMTQGFRSPSQMTSQHLFCSRGVASHGKTNARWNKNRKNYKVTFCQRQASSRNAWCECASKSHRNGGLLKSRQAQVTHLSAFRWASAKFGPVLPQRGFISHETHERRGLLVKGPWKTSKTHPNPSKTKVSYIRVAASHPKVRSLYISKQKTGISRNGH